MSDPVLLCDDRGAIRRLTLNRPDKLNALNTALTTALTAAIEEAARAPDIRAIVIGGAGRAFCAGADVKELADVREENAIREHAARTARLHHTLSHCAKPTIAAVHGLALGGGCGLALACDLVVCSGDAQFGYPEMVRGVVPAIVTPNLVRQVGWKAAFELLATGARIDAHRALALGMVNRVAAAGDTMAEALRLAGDLAARDPTAMRWLKRVFQEVREGSLDQALEAARDANAQSRIERLAGPARPARCAGVPPPST